MPNRLFYTIKLDSGLLKENKYDLNLSFNECFKNGLVISLADSQMLRSIRDITGKKVDRSLLEKWYEERDTLKKRKNNKSNRAKIKELQNNIYDMMYIPQYITVVMNSIKEYEKIFKKGFLFNGKLYKRFSCSASQARVSTVVFVDVDIKDELKTRLDNGRNLNKPLAPSKYNAYFGLYSSATKEVTKPRFCIIPDYCENRDVDVDFVIETEGNRDDIIEPRTLSVEFNMNDGSGLISPQMAQKWAEDIGEDYVPCQFCIRCSFTKGALNEFDFVEWCKECNNGNYTIKDIYGNLVDLREIDVILTESMAKLWDSWDSQESFENCCKENGIIWGVTKYAPKEDKECSTVNYQFLQTLDLNDEMIKSVCEDTVKYIEGVSYSNIYYTLLFLLGQSMDENKIKKFMESSDNYWLKCLILNHNLLNDKYSKEKIRDYVIKKISQACLGRINVRGNFQCIVVDGYAFMQHCTGQKVTGLLKAGEFYSQFWNRYDVDKVDCMRSPLTHFSEHYVVNLRNTEEMQKWYKYSYSGIIVNCHDAHTMNFAGSDYDFDILFTTNNKDFINGVYPNQRVVTYNAKKPHKKLFTEEDLFYTDTFSFGTRIGQITNICSTICAMIPEFEKGSKERKLLEDRVKMCCASQSRQIDKTKIGENVKADIPLWKQYQRYSDDDTPEQKAEKDFYNSILADKKPYFFRYKYPQLNKEYNDFNKKMNEDCELRYCISLETLKKIPEKDLTDDQKRFIMLYNKYLPVIETDCVMNKICKYIENKDFQIKQKVKSSEDFDWRILVTDNFQISKTLYAQICEKVYDVFNQWKIEERDKKKKRVAKIGIDFEEFQSKEGRYIDLKQQLEEICSNEEQLTNHLVYLFYVDKPSYNKTILWYIVGKQIYETVKNKISSYYIPVKNVNGSLEFLYEKYSIERINIEKEGETK